jgi:hypothetical protein
MKYRSKLENKVALLLGEEWAYEEYKIPYTMERQYLTDFTKDNIVLEVKGFFRPGDQAKYKAIRDCLGEGDELVFCFPDPNKPVRRGAKLTLGKWCERNNIRYTSVSNLRSFLDGKD